MKGHHDLSRTASKWLESKIAKTIAAPGVVHASKTEICNALERAICHKKRAILPIPRASRIMLKREIESCVEKNTPVTLVSPFGSYKPSNLPSPITPNWAECIHLFYMVEIANEIAALHSPGVRLSYKLGDIDMAHISSVREHDVAAYYEGFKGLVDRFNSMSSRAVTISASRLSDYVSAKQFREQTNDELNRLRSVWDRRGRDADILEVIKRTKRNNYARSLSDPEAYEIALRSAAMVKTDLNHLAEENAVNLVYRKLTDEMCNGIKGVTLLPFMASSGTLVQFWVGEGVLVWNGRKLYASILGQKSVMKLDVIQEIKVSLFEGCGSNLEKLKICKG